MIRNRYNYLLHSVPRHQRERRIHLTQLHCNPNTTSRKRKGQFLSPKWRNGHLKYKIHQDIHAKTYNDRNSKKKVRECRNHKPQPFPDTKRKRKQTKSNKRKSNKRTKNTNFSSLLLIAMLKGLKKHKNKLTQGKT